MLGRRLSQLAMAPIHGALVFGQGKSFERNPFLGSKTLNRLGLHAARTVAAATSARVRWWLLSPLLRRELRERLHRDGYVVIDGYLSPREVEQVTAEIPSLDGTAWEMRQGDSITRRMLLDPAAVRHTPKLRSIIGDRQLLNMLAYVGAKWRKPLFYMQRVQNQGGRQDPQKNLHSDTFHASMKAWLFLEDVTPEKGPFHYVPGSHRLDARRLRWEHETSLRAAELDDGYSRKGSLRMREEDLPSLGLPAPVPLTVSAGSLVIANTRGFHRRGQSQPGATRLALWAYSRHNPFSLWPGAGLMQLGRIEEMVLQRWWRFELARAERRGGRPFWRPIEPSALVAPVR